MLVFTLANNKLYQGLSCQNKGYNVALAFRMVSNKEASGPKKPPFLLGSAATGVDAAASAMLYNRSVAR